MDDRTKNLLRLHAFKEQAWDELDGSERAVAIVHAAILEHTLKHILRDYFRQDRTVANRWLGTDTSSGRLGASDCKELAYLLGLISKPAFNDIERIVWIRNCFAHYPLRKGTAPDKLHPPSFEDSDEIGKRCDAFELIPMIRELPWMRIYPPEVKSDIEDQISHLGRIQGRLAKYVATCMLLYQFLTDAPIPARPRSPLI